MGFERISFVFNPMIKKRQTPLLKGRTHIKKRPADYATDTTPAEFSFYAKAKGFNFYLNM